MRIHLSACLGGVLGMWALAPTAFAQITGLKSRIPTDANAVVIIDSEKLFGSAAADKGRWEAKRKAAFDSGMTFLSPATTGVVIASKMDLEFGKTLWELSQVRLSTAGNTASIATRFGGKPDMIEGRSAVRLPNDSIVVQVTDNSFAAYTPANRQDVARWLRSTDTQEVNDNFSPYIQQAFSYVENVGTPIILAVDMHGVFSEDYIKSRLASGPLAEKYKDKIDGFAKALVSIKGAMLGVSVGEGVIGSVRVDFDSDISALRDVGKEMFLSALERQGAMIEDIREWELSFNGNSMFLKGSLSDSGLRRVLSVLALPPSLGHSMDEMKLADGGDSESLVRVTSQQYFTSVTTLLDDLQKERKRAKSVTPGGLAMWYEKYARKIDNLPILNVDDTLLDYGRQVSDLLRGGEGALKNVGMRSSVRQGMNEGPTGNYYENDYYGYGAYGGYRAGYSSGYYVNPYYANREKGRTDAIIRGQETTYGAAQVQEMWTEIEKQTATIRREMTQKYNVEF